MSRYIYTQSEPSLWTVGTGEPRTPSWEPESDHDTEQAAADRVHWLNGGGPRIADEFQTLKDRLTAEKQAHRVTHADAERLQGELDTAKSTIERLRKELHDKEREFQREAREIAAEARWQERQSQDSDYGSY